MEYFSANPYYSQSLFFDYYQTPFSEEKIKDIVTNRQVELDAVLGDTGYDVDEEMEFLNTIFNNPDYKLLRTLEMFLFRLLPLYRRLRLGDFRVLRRYGVDTMSHEDIIRLPSPWENTWLDRFKSISEETRLILLDIGHTEEKIQGFSDKVRAYKAYHHAMHQPQPFVLTPAIIWAMIGVIGSILALIFILLRSR